MVCTLTRFLPQPAMQEGDWCAAACTKCCKTLRYRTMTIGCVSLRLSRTLRLRPTEVEPPAANLAQTVKLLQRCATSCRPTLTTDVCPGHFRKHSSAIVLYTHFFILHIRYATLHSLIKRISDIPSQGCTHFQTFVQCLDRRGVVIQDAIKQGCVMHIHSHVSRISGLRAAEKDS